MAAVLVLLNLPLFIQWRPGRLKVAYVLSCPAHARRFDHAGLGPASLQARLDRGQVPAWLAPASSPGAALSIYRVRAAGERP